MNKKQRAARLMEAAKRVHRGASWHSCSAIHATSGRGYTEAGKYADYVGVSRYSPAFPFSAEHRRYYTGEQRQLTRELAILMYREAVLAGEV